MVALKHQVFVSFLIFQRLHSANIIKDKTWDRSLHLFDIGLKKCLLRNRINPFPLFFLIQRLCLNKSMVQYLTGVAIIFPTFPLVKWRSHTWGWGVRCRFQWWSVASPGWRWVAPPACCSPEGRSLRPPSASWPPDDQKKQTFLDVGLKFSFILQRFHFFLHPSKPESTQSLRSFGVSPPLWSWISSSELKTPVYAWRCSSSGRLLSCSVHANTGHVLERQRHRPGAGQRISGRHLTSSSTWSSWSSLL